MLERQHVGRAAALSGLCCLIGAACATDTRGLARRDPDPMGQGGGGAGASMLPPIGLDDAGTQLGAGGSRAAPSGPGQISVVHGVVDGGSLFICLRDGVGAALGSDVPQPPGGMAYGGVHPLPVAWDVSDQEVQAHLFTADPAQMQGASCAELIASAALIPGDGPSGLDPLDAGAADSGVRFPTQPAAPRRAGALTLAQGALGVGAQYVLVASGCATLGVQPGVEVCGAPEALFGSHLALTFVELGASKPVDSPFIGLQFLHASRAINRVDVLLQGTGPNASRLAAEVPFGGLRPRAPAAFREPVGLELHGPGQALSAYTQAWSDTLSWSGVVPLELGRSYLLLYVGPAPSVAASSGFAPPRFVLVPGPR
jgi:hypothetical protein